ncbi:(Fe-S)-binding protein [Fibrisoma limi]|nr:(Fe-S)-binding protein [Fibrisoma limi]
MNVALFVPCYVDQFFPQVGVATLELLEKLGCAVTYPTEQTCCGQPMANAGYEHLASGCEMNVQRIFSSFEYVVTPSGSCTVHLREHLPAAHGSRIYEVCEFLTDVLRVKSLAASFPHRIGLHSSCHGLRGLRLASMSEQNEPAFSKPIQLLSLVDGLELVYPERPDECCGFGGTFCVTEEAVSVKMGQDRVDEHLANNVDYIVGSDMSCLMHLQGILRRRKSNTDVLHIAQVLNAYEPA